MQARVWGVDLATLHPLHHSLSISPHSRTLGIIEPAAWRSAPMRWSSGSILFDIGRPAVRSPPWSTLVNAAPETLKADIGEGCSWLGGCWIRL